MSKRKRIRQAVTNQPSSAEQAEALGASAVSRWRTAAVSALLAIVTFVTYARVLGNEFIYLDDRTYVTENTTVQQGLTWNGVKWAFSTTHAANWHPVTWLSHMLDCELFGLDARGHHLTNLLLHVFNVVLLFSVLRRMTGAIGASAFVAAAFGLHPAHVESVAWVAERKDVLSTFLGLLAMLAYVRYAEKHTMFRYLVVFLLFAVGLSAKPMLVTLPFVFLLLDYWPLRRMQNMTSATIGIAKRCALLLAEKLPLIFLAGASGATTVYAQRAGGAMMTQAMLPPQVRIENALISLVKYLAMACWPSGLAVYYPHPLEGYPIAEVAGAIVVISVITLFALFFARKHSYLPVGWLWFVGTMIPVIGLVQVGGQAMADRYTYVPYIGLFIMVTWGIRAVASVKQRSSPKGDPPPLPRGDTGVLAPVAGDQLSRRRFSTIALRAVSVSVLVLLAAATWVQAGFWHDSKRLFQRAIDVVPDNTQAHIFIAQTLVREGRSADAAPHFAEAVRIVPNEPFNLTDYGHALVESGRMDEAAEPLERAIELLPSHAAAHYFLGVVRGQQHRPREAIQHLQEALRLDPKLLRAHDYLGSIYAETGQYVQAIAHLRKWLDVDPRSSPTLVKLGQCYFAVGNPDAARATMEQAADANPNDAYALAALAQVVWWQGEADVAIQLYERAVEAAPNYAAPLTNLAMIYATMEDPRLRNVNRAVELAEQACRLTGFKDPVSLDALAAAYAEVGHIDDAMKTISAAIEIARTAGDAKLVQYLESRRAQYSAGRALRSGDAGAKP